MIGLYFNLKGNVGIFKQRLYVLVFGCVNDQSTLQGSRICWDFELELLFSENQSVVCKASKCSLAEKSRGFFREKQW